MEDKTLKLVENDESSSPKENIVYEKYTQEQIEEKQKQLNDFKNSLQSKLYLVSDNKEIGHKIIQWLMKDVTWTYTECIGVVKLTEEIQGVLESKDTNQLFLSMGAITALNYLFQKTTLQGYETALRHKEMILPIVEVMNGSIKMDSDTVQKLEWELASMTEGIKPYTEGEENAEQE